MANWASIALDAIDGVTVPRRILFTLYIVVSAVWIIFAVEATLNAQHSFSDFAVFYAAAATLRDHSGSIYSISTIIATAQRHHAAYYYHHPAYLYPPLLAILLMPLASLPYGVALEIWVILQLAFWAGSAALIGVWLIRSGISGHVATTIAATFGLLCWPLASGLVQFAQLDALVLLCLLLAPWLIIRGRPAWGGAALAFIAMVKVVPILLIVYYLLRGRRRVVSGALICGAVMLVLQLAVVGLPEFLAMHNILSNSAVFVSQADNFSLLHFPVWLALIFGVSVPVGMSLPGDILVILVALVFVAVVPITRLRMVVAGMTSQVEQEQVVDLLGYAWAVCAMMLLTPLVWLHYLGWLLVPLTLCGGYLLSPLSPHKRFASLALLVFGYALATVRLPLLYDTTPEYVLGPALGQYAWRPLAMALHPLGEALMWSIAGSIFVQASRVKGHLSYRGPYNALRVETHSVEIHRRK